MKIAVIGAGVAGLCSAYFLSKRGYEVVVLEKDRCGRGCSWDAAGMLAPVNELEFQELPLLKAGVASRNLYGDLEADLGDIGLIRTGTLEVGLRADDEAFLRRLYQFQLENGLAVTWKNGPALLEMEPFVSRNLPGGIWSVSDIQVDNRALVLALKAFLLQQGQAIHEGTAVQEFERVGEQMKVKAEGGEWTVDKVVVATGTGKVAGNPLPFKVYPVRGEMIALEPPKYPFLRKTIRIRNKILGNAYVVPKKDRILCGATSEEQGFDPSNTAGGLLDILRKCYAAVPGIYELRVLETWAGLRPSTLTRLPVVDREADRPVYHINGLYRHGILLAPLLGKALAELIATGQRLPEVEDFRMPRF